MSKVRASIIYPEVRYPRSYGELIGDRSGFQRAFCDWVTGEPTFKGKVLDIGCGFRLPVVLNEFAGKYGQLDGVDPHPSVEAHPLLCRRWVGRFEDCDIPASEYDLAYAYNVVEHIEDPGRFLENVSRVLRPGGVFWALTPHKQHPFALLSRVIEVLGCKRIVAAYLAREHGGGTIINDYPAYYRLNRASTVVRLIRGLGFSEAAFYHYPCMQWDMYFPRVIRWAPRLYDLLLGTRFRAFMQIFGFRLRKHGP